MFIAQYISSIFVLMLITIQCNAYQLKDQCDFHETIQLTGNYTQNGSVIEHNDITYPQEFWSELNYTVQFNHDIKALEKVAAEPKRWGCLCRLTECIRLCCNWGEHFTGEYCDKVDDFQVWMNVSHDGNTRLVNIAEHEDYKNRLVYGSAHCEYADYGIEQDINVFYKNGSVKSMPMGNADKSVWYNHANYCLEVQPNGKIKTLFCYESIEQDQILFDVNSYCMSLSLPFLLMTFIVYASLPQLRNQHGKSIMFYVTGLSIGYVCRVMTYTAAGIKEPYCSIFPYLSYFGFMLSFFWLNAMCIDIWLLFGQDLFHVGQFRRFRYYLWYACCSPVLFLATLLTMDLLKIEGFTSGIGDGYCSFAKTNFSKLIFLFIPMGTLIILNLILYLMTIFKMRERRRHSNKILRNGQNWCSNDDECQLMLNARLIVVMGVTWTTEILTWFTQDGTTLHRVILYACNACNGLQGVFIFVLFVLRKNIGKLIMKRWRNATQKEIQPTTFAVPVRQSYLKNSDIYCINVDDEFLNGKL